MHLTKTEISLQRPHPRSLISLRGQYEEAVHPFDIQNASRHTTNVQSDLNHCWEHMSVGTFSDVAAYMSLSLGGGGGKT